MDGVLSVLDVFGVTKLAGMGLKTLGKEVLEEIGEHAGKKVIEETGEKISREVGAEAREKIAKEAMKQLQQANSTTLSNFNYNWMKSEDVTYEFLDKVVDISEKLGASPDDLMAVMVFESGINPQCTNSIGASGLIQFTDISLSQIYLTTGKSYAIEDIQNMNALEELDVVYLHCKGNGNISTLSDLYMSVLCPVAVGEDDDYCLYSIGTPGYEVNKGLDLNGDGRITKAEATEKVLERKATYEYE